MFTMPIRTLPGQPPVTDLLHPGVAGGQLAHGRVDRVLARRGAWVQFDNVQGDAPYRTGWLLAAIRRTVPGEWQQSQFTSEDCDDFEVCA